MFARNALRSNFRSFAYVSQRNKSTVEKAKEFGEEVLKTSKVLGKGIEKAEEVASKIEKAADLKIHPTDTIKEGIDKASHIAGEGLAKGLEYVERAAEKTKDAVGLASKQAEKTIEQAKKVSKTPNETVDSAEKIVRDGQSKAKKTLNEAKDKF